MAGGQSTETQGLQAHCAFSPTLAARNRPIPTAARQLQEVAELKAG